MGHLPSTLQDSAVARFRPPPLDPRVATATSELRQPRNRWERHQYDFHWHDEPVPPPLTIYRTHQQDAMKATWVGLVAGTDGSVDKRSERMGAGYAIGARLSLPASSQHL